VCTYYGLAVKKRFWLLGSRDDIAAVGWSLTAALGVDLDEHESGYLGGKYLRGRSSSLEEVIVQSNFADEEGSLAEADFPDYMTLCYVTQTFGSGPLPNLADVGIDVLRVEEL
jgi:hypothetical protein